MEAEEICEATIATLLIESDDVSESRINDLAQLTNVYSWSDVQI